MVEAPHGDVMAHLAEDADEIEFFATQRMLRRLARATGTASGPALTGPLSAGKRVA